MHFSIEEGWETTLTINDVNTMLLAVLVHPKLVESAKKFGIVPHLVIVGSNVGVLEAVGVIEAVEGDVLEGLTEVAFSISPLGPVLARG